MLKVFRPFSTQDKRPPALQKVLPLRLKAVPSSRAQASLSLHAGIRTVQEGWILSYEWNIEEKLLSFEIAAILQTLPRYLLFARNAIAKNSYFLFLERYLLTRVSNTSHLTPYSSNSSGSPWSWELVCIRPNGRFHIRVLRPFGSND